MIDVILAFILGVIAGFLATMALKAQIVIKP